MSAASRSPASVPVAAAAVAALAADAVQGVAHQRIGGGVGGVLDLVGLGDRGARHAHGGRGGAGGVAVLEEVGDVDGAGGQLAAAVGERPALPRFPGAGVGAAGGRGECGDRGGAAALLLAAIRIACYLRGAVLSGIRRRAVGGAGDGRERELAVQVGQVEGVLLGGVHSIGLPTAVRRRPRSWR